MKKRFILLSLLFPATFVLAKELLAVPSGFQDSVKKVSYSRVCEPVGGKVQDRIVLKYRGQEISAYVDPDSKVAFIVNNKLYEEKEFKQLLKKNKNQLPAASSRKEASFQTSRYAKVFNLN